MAPRTIRERPPRATIIAFGHVPFPNAERFGICPWREELREAVEMSPSEPGGDARGGPRRVAGP
ncbi:MAG: trehalose-6-phosphate synthase [Gemmatimonadaceae bacterium]|nr:trehalose-6-phosphate synthase [Gemmatimonadaceae bacterium]